MKRTFFAATALSMLLVSTSAVAHTVWLRHEDGNTNTFKVVFGGHQGKIDPYKASKLKAVEALDATGKKLAVTRSGGDNAVELQVKGKPVMMLVHFDNGTHTRTGTGPSVEKPMNQVDGAVSATSAVKYHKTIVAWGGSIVTKPVGQPFEIIPQSAVAPRAGQPMRIQVRIDGKPVQGVKIGRGEDDGTGTTDAQGMVGFTPQAGFNKIWAGKRFATTGNPAYTELSYEYTLGFDAQ